MKRYLTEETGVKEHSVRNLYREAGRQNLIENVDAWFEYHTARNLTSHTYNEITAMETYEAAKLFVKDAAKLLSELEKVCGDTAN